MLDIYHILMLMHSPLARLQVFNPMSSTWMGCGILVKAKVAYTNLYHKPRKTYEKA